jgi:hypothetical protein
MSNELLTDNQVQKMNKDIGLTAFKKESIQDDSLKTSWQHCPLCPGHLDESDGFRWNHLLNDQVCLGCSYDIHFALVGEAERPLVSAGYDYSETFMGLLEQLTGQTFHQLKFRHLKEEKKSRTGATPNYVTGIDFLALPESELRLLNKRLDDELNDIIETEENAASDARTSLPT